MQKSDQFSVQIRINKNTMARELVIVNKDRRCAT